MMFFFTFLHIQGFKAWINFPNDLYNGENLMSQLFQMCMAIVNYPKNEMNVDEVIESMNGSAFNPHRIRCALSKIAHSAISYDIADGYSARNAWN